MKNAVILAIAGLVIVSVSFIFILANILKGVTDLMNDKDSVLSIFTNSIYAMVGMGIGALTTTAGLIWAIVLVI